MVCKGFDWLGTLTLGPNPKIFAPEISGGGTADGIT
jgi:hypothetical protein